MNGGWRIENAENRRQRGQMNYKRNKRYIVFSIILLSASMSFVIFSLLSSTRAKGNILLTMLNFVVDCCVIFFNKIGTFILLEKMTLAYIGLAFLSYGLVEAIINLGTGWRKIKKLIAQLNITKRIKYRDNVYVNIFDSPHLLVAWTMGILKPEIYLSSGIWNSLKEDEKASVLAHEFHHAAEKDPLKILFLKFIADIFFFVPLIKYLIGKFEEAMEKSADDEVRTHGINELSLATALLKVQKNGGAILPVASFANIDSKSLIESRVIRLIQPEKEKRFKIPRKIISATALLYLVLLVSAFTLPDNLQKTGECIHNKEHSSCPQMTPEECKKHCKQMMKRNKKY